MSDFMASQKERLKKTYQKMLQFDTHLLDQSNKELQEYLRRNQFKAYLNMTSDLLLTTVQGWLWHNYEDSAVRVYKLPAEGTNDDFGWTLIGNEDYEKLKQDIYYKKGKIFTSRDKDIIPSPEEAAEGQTLLFRTSHGETVQADPYLDTLITSFMSVQTPSILQAYLLDVKSFFSSRIR
jgi:hypothetical protein